MTASRVSVRSSVQNYKLGKAKAGWCCAADEGRCHRTFEHRGHPRRGFARFALHRLVRHGRTLFGPPLTSFCSITHTTPTAARTTWTVIGSFTRVNSYPVEWEWRAEA